MLNHNEIVQTITMIKDLHLDIRTVTMHLSLFDCITDNADTTALKVYNKLKEKAKDFVEIVNGIQSKYGIPIINKRLSVSPISLIGASSGGYEKIALAMDKAAKECNVNFIGGYSKVV